jgi:energy-coupling factor transport system permease protein
MKGQDAFSGYHPLVNFLFFALVLVCSMCLMHPVALAISLVSALIYRARLGGRGAVGSALKYLIPIMLLAAVLNPAFNHQGATILTYLPSGNPLTLESILYGLAAAGMLGAVLTWFGCCNVVLTSDKFIYLFGRIIPSLSLVLSMTLRFVPRFRAQLRTVRQAQASIGRDSSSGSLLRRARRGVTLLSILITWALENAIDTADSMKSRGYGLPGRTAFTLYRLDSRDKSALVWLTFCGIYLLAGAMAGGLSWRYYPTLGGNLTGAFPLSFQAVYLALCLTPVILDRKEAVAWQRSNSKT